MIVDKEMSTCNFDKVKTLVLKSQKKIYVYAMLDK